MLMVICAVCVETRSYIKIIKFVGLNKVAIDFL